MSKQKCINKQKRIVLYNPKAVFYDMPLALMALGSCFDQSEYEVVIVDGRLHDDPLPLLNELMDDAICFGVTVLTGSPLKDALDVTKTIKQAFPDVPVIWGGWHPSLFPTAILEDTPEVDITVQGQGEVTFQNIVNAIESGEGFESIKGICFRKDGKVKKNPGAPLTPMNNLPSVDYSLIDVERYFELKGKRQLDYISSTGCYFRCTFCADPFVFNRSFTAIDAERMGAEIEDLYQKYQFEDLNFQDETFFTYPKRVSKIADEFIERGIEISWAGTMRADQGARMTDEQFEKCVKSGLRRVLIGVESGSQEMMDWLSKDIKIEQVYFCAERCKKYGVGVIFPFIVGFPGESDESILATRKVVLDLVRMSPKFETPIFYFKPYPGSKITDDVVKQGYQLPDSTMAWADFDYIGSKGPWVSEEKYRFFESFKFYVKAAYRNTSVYRLPLKWTAKLRCKMNFFSWSWEKSLYDKVVKQQELS